MLKATEDLVPRRLLAELTSIAREVDEVLGEFLRGQLSVMLSLAAYYTVALWAVGLNSALSIGLLTGLLAFVPYLGFTFGVILATAVGLIQFQSVASLLPIWGVFVGGQPVGELCADPMAGGGSSGTAPGVGDLRDTRVRAAPRLRRRAARGAACRCYAGAHASPQAPVPAQRPVQRLT